MTKNLICIACPRGCRLTVRVNDTLQEAPLPDNIKVSGNSCPKGIAYGRQEIVCPMRTLTTTVGYTIGTNNAFCKPRRMRLPVKTACEIPLNDILPVIRQIHALNITKAVHCGDTIAVLKESGGIEIPITACASTEENV